MTIVESIAAAIAQMEGFNSQGSVAQRQNNPGNLRSWGSNPVIGGYAKFPNVTAGWSALYSQIQKNINRGLSLNEFFGGKPGVYPGYSPGSDGGNRPANYAAFVGSHVGIPVDVPINQFGSSPPFPRKAPKPRTPGA